MCNILWGLRVIAHDCYDFLFCFVFWVLAGCCLGCVMY